MSASFDELFPDEGAPVKKKPLKVVSFDELFPDEGGTSKPLGSVTTKPTPDYTKIAQSNSNSVGILKPDALDIASIPVMQRFPKRTRSEFARGEQMPVLGSLHNPHPSAELAQDNTYYKDSNNQTQLREVGNIEATVGNFMRGALRTEQMVKNIDPNQELTDARKRLSEIKQYDGYYPTGSVKAPVWVKASPEEIASLNQQSKESLTSLGEADKVYNADSAKYIKSSERINLERDISNASGFVDTVKAIANPATVGLLGESMVASLPMVGISAFTKNPYALMAIGGLGAGGQEYAIGATDYLNQNQIDIETATPEQIDSALAYAKNRATYVGLGGVASGALAGAKLPINFATPSKVVMGNSAIQSAGGGLISGGSEYLAGASNGNANWSDILLETAGDSLTQPITATQETLHAMQLKGKNFVEVASNEELLDIATNPTTPKDLALEASLGLMNRGMAIDANGQLVTSAQANAQPQPLGDVGQLPVATQAPEPPTTDIPTSLGEVAPTTPVAPSGDINIDDIIGAIFGEQPKPLGDVAPNVDDVFGKQLPVQEPVQQGDTTQPPLTGGVTVPVAQTPIKQEYAIGTNEWGINKDSTPDTNPEFESLKRSLKNGKNDTYKGKVDDLKLVHKDDVPQDLQDIFTMLEERSNTPIRLVINNDQKKQVSFGGVHLRNKGIWVVGNSKDNGFMPSVILFHELNHNMKVQDPDLYQRLADFVRKDTTYKIRTEFAKERGYTNLTADKRLEELVSDSVGNAGADIDFLKRLAKKDPNLFKDLADKLIKYLDEFLARAKALGKSKSDNTGSDKYLKDVEGFRNVLEEVLIEHHKRGIARTEASKVSPINNTKVADNEQKQTKPERESDKGRSDGAVSTKADEGTLQDSGDVGGSTELLGDESGQASNQDAKAPQSTDKEVDKADTITIDGVVRSTVNSNGKRIANTDEQIKNFWKWFGDSKVVDAKGRPLVVYHGTRSNVSKFDPSKTGGLINLTSMTHTANTYSSGEGGNRGFSKNLIINNDTGESFEPKEIDGLRIKSWVGSKGTIVTTEQIESGLDDGEFSTFKEGANVMPLYAKANLLDLTSKEGKEILSKLNAENNNIVNDIINEARKGNFEWSSTKNEAQSKVWGNILNPQLEELGYTGIKFKDNNYADPYTIAVFNKSQVKSAIGNNGDFSKDTDVIYKDISPRAISEAIDRARKEAEGKQYTPSSRKSARIGIQRNLELLESGKITNDEFVRRMGNILKGMEDVAADKRVSGAFKDRVRGVDRIKERMLQAKRNGDISDETYDFMEWFVNKNQDLFNELGISVKSSEAGSSGEYNPATRIMTLFKGSANDTTAVHEALHHLERMMPKDMQQAIKKEWMSALVKAQNSSDENISKYAGLIFDSFTNPESLNKAMEMLMNQEVPYNLYGLVNASEYWAVNMTDTLDARYQAKDSVIQRTKVWLEEALEHIKSALGLTSNAPMLKALNKIMKEGNGNIAPKSKMLSEAKVYAQLTPISQNVQDAAKKANAIATHLKDAGSSFKKTVEDLKKTPPSKKGLLNDIERIRAQFADQLQSRGWALVKSNKDNKDLVTLMKTVFRPHGNAVGVAKATYGEEVDQINNTFLNRVQKILTDAGITGLYGDTVDPKKRKAIKDKYEADNLALNDAILFPDKKHPIYIRKAADAISALLKVHHEDLVEAGVDVGEVTDIGYLSRIYDKNKIFADEIGFLIDTAKYMQDFEFKREVGETAKDIFYEKERLREFLTSAKSASSESEKIKIALGKIKDLSEDYRFGRISFDGVKEIEGIIDSIYDDVAKHYGERRAQAFLYGLKTPQASKHTVSAAGAPVTKERVLAGEASVELSKWLNNDVKEILGSYSMATARRISHARHYGGKGELLQKMYNDASKTMNKQDIDEMEHLIMSSLGEGKSGGIPSPLQVAGDYVGSVGTMALLPASMAISLAETMQTAQVTGNPLDLFSPLFQAINFIRKTKKREDLHHLADAFGLVQNMANDAMMMNRAGMNYEMSSRPRRWLSKFFQSTGLTQLTNGQHSYLISPLHDMVKGMAVRHLSGKSKEIDSINFDEMGIDDRDSFAKWVTGMNGLPSSQDLFDSNGRTTPNGQRWITAVTRYAKMIVQDPDLTLKQDWVQDRRGALMSGLMSFSQSFYTNLMKRPTLINEQLAKRGYTSEEIKQASLMVGTFASVFVAQTLVTVLLEAMKDIDQFDDDEDKEELTKKLLGKAFFRTVSFGSVDPIIQLVARVKYQQDVSDTVVGPSPSIVFKAINEAIALAGDRNSPNTDNQERKATEAAYIVTVVPAIGMAVSHSPLPTAVTSLLIPYITGIGTRNELLDNFFNQKEVDSSADKKYSVTKKEYEQSVSNSKLTLSQLETDADIEAEYEHLKKEFPVLNAYSIKKYKYGAEPSKTNRGGDAGDIVRAKDGTPTLINEDEEFKDIEDSIADLNKVIKNIRDREVTDKMVASFAEGREIKIPSNLQMSNQKDRNGLIDVFKKKRDEAKDEYRKRLEDRKPQ